MKRGNQFWWAIKKSYADGSTGFASLGPGSAPTLWKQYDRIYAKSAMRSMEKWPGCKLKLVKVKFTPPVEK